MVIVASLIVAGTAVMFTFDRQFTVDREHRPLSGWLLASFALFALVTLGNGISTLLECAGGLCPDDPKGYLLFQ